MAQNIEIDRSSPVPVYYQIETDLKNRIMRREWALNERLPTEVELAQQYDVSRITLRQALAELKKDGIIRKQRGKGTYIDGDPSPFVTDLSYSLVSGDRITGHQITARILEQRLVSDLFPAVSEHLQLPPSAQAVYIKRLFLLNGRPVAVNRAHIRADAVPGLESRLLLHNSISQSLLQYYHLQPQFVEDYIEAVRATQAETSLLECAYDTPLILISGTSYLHENDPLEYTTTLWAGDCVRFHLHLQHGDKGFLIGP